MFDFLGKDSIRYINEVTVEPKVFKNLKLFKAPPKTEKDLLFDRLNTASLNKHLNQIMDGLTAKVFRTYNASYTFQEELKKTPTDGTVAEKILAYNRANREVAVLCNHQRTVSKAHEGQMGRINDRILEIKYKRSLVKKQLKEIDPDYVKKHPKYGKKEEGLTSKWIKQYLAEQFIKEKEKLKKRFELDNEKRKQAGEPLIDEYELTEQLDAVAEKEKQLAKGEYEPDPPLKTNVTTERLAAKVDKLSEQLMNAETLA
ncbi:DNA topoisomerase 1, partial [Spiromyces aspiralis]